MFVWRVAGSILSRGKVCLFGFFSFPITFGGSVWVRARAASSIGTVSSVPTWFRADSGTNLIRQGEIVTVDRVAW